MVGLAFMPDVAAQQQAAFAAYQQNAATKVLEGMAEFGSIVGAARHANIAPRTIQYWLERYPAFALECDRAKALYGEKITQHIHEAVFEGQHEATTKHPVLTIFHAKRYVPEYRDRSELHVSGTIHIEDKLRPDQRLAIRAQLTGMDDEADGEWRPAE